MQIRPGTASHALVVWNLASDHPEKEPCPGVAHVRELLVQRLLGRVEISERVEIALESFVFRVELEHSPGVGGDGLELPPVANDARVAHQLVDVPGREPGHALRIEALE